MPRLKNDELKEELEITFLAYEEETNQLSAEEVRNYVRNQISSLKGESSFA